MPGQVGYALLTRAPVDAHQNQAFDVVSPRLACVQAAIAAFPAVKLQLADGSIYNHPGKVVKMETAEA